MSTKYHVTVEYLNTRTGEAMHSQRVTVYTDTREQAPAEAVKKQVRAAKAYNAKYSAQGLPEWALRNDSADGYRATKVRKAPVKSNR